MVHIYEISNGTDSGEELKDLLSRLPKWRLHKALSFRQDIDRFLCAKSFLMLEEMLREHCGLAGCPEFSYESHGKPYFRDYPEIFFNISHCHKGIACAVLNEPVGIDIEEIQFDDEIAKAIFSPQELGAVRSSDEPAVKFTEIWTRKESFLKLTGEGLADNLTDALSDTRQASIITEINRSAGYVCSTAVWRKRPLAAH